MCFDFEISYLYLLCNYNVKVITFQPVYASASTPNSLIRAINYQIGKRGMSMRDTSQKRSKYIKTQNE